MLNNIKSRITSCEQQTRFVQDRINQVDRQFAELCHVFSDYSRRASKIRDRHNDIAKNTLNYAESETINKSLSNGLTNFSSCLATISDYGDARVQSIDAKVVSELSHYGLVCKHAKDDLKHIFLVRDRENSKKRSLDRLRERNPRNRQQLIQAETELVKATAEVSRSRHNLEDQTNAFERKKLHDVKGILLDFISTEMGFYARALELMTKAYQDIDSIDEDADLKDFKKTMQSPETVPHSSLTTNKRAIFSRSTPSLGSITHLFSASHQSNARRSPGIPNRNSPGIPRSPRRELSKSADVLDRRSSKSADILNRRSSKSSAESVDSESENDSDSISEPPPEVGKRFMAPKYRK